MGLRFPFVKKAAAAAFFCLSSLALSRLAKMFFVVPQYCDPGFAELARTRAG